MEKKKEFRIRFKENGLGDWEMILNTTEPKTEDEIKSLIEYWIEVNQRNFDDYSPVNILDDLCEDKGWEWEDMKYNDIVFEESDWIIE